MLTVGGAGQTFNLPLAPDVDVRKPTPATFADLAAGTPLVAVGTAGPDGVLLASVVRVAEPPAVALAE